jgi:hypothetical protein
MIDFNSMILKAISDYKVILRKTLPAPICVAKMHELGIKRKYVKEVDVVGLYKIGQKIIAELKQYVSINKRRKSNNFYQGASEFLQYLEEIFANYCIEDNRVVHVGQKASSALVNAIQLITLSQGKLTKSKALQVVQYGNVVASCGTKEQREMFINAINEHQKYLISELPEEMLTGFA